MKRLKDPCYRFVGREDNNFGLLERAAYRGRLTISDSVFVVTDRNSTPLHQESISILKDAGYLVRDMLQVPERFFPRYDQT